MILEVICGPMFSGKTEELIRRITRAKFAKQVVLSFKPKMDNRYSADEIVSHSGAHEQCYAVEDATDILDIIIQQKKGLPHLIAVEEVQFFDQDEFQNLLDFLKTQNTKMIVAGLDMDFAGVPFENVAFAMGIANRVDKLSAVCVECSSDATMTFKKTDSTQRVEVGKTGIYEARCYQCWRPSSNFSF